MKMIRTRYVRHSCLVGSAMLTLASLTATGAHAQSATDDNADSSEILVTAQRRSERLEDVPMSVAVVSQERLDSAGINSVRDLANVTTGFQVANSGSVPQPAIRGVTTTTAGSYENNVALFVDGLYQTTPQVLNMDLPNIQDIQILKGPQGTLYGRNATGGAILISTIDPGDAWTGNIEATYGRFDDRRGRAFIAGPLTDTIGVSLSGTIRHTDGYYKVASRTTPGAFDGNGLPLKQEALRAKLRFDLSETFRATLGYSYIRASDPRGTFFTPTENVANSYVVAGRTTRPRGLGEVAGDAFANELKQHEGSLKLELETGIGTLRSVTGYTDGRNQTTYDSSGTYVPDLYIDAIVRDRTWQENLDFTINAIDRLDLILGGNYYNIKTDYLPGYANVVYLGPASISPFTYPDPAVTPTPLSSYLKSSESAFFRTKEAWAVFMDATFRATDRLSITVGGRYSHESQDVSAYKNNFSTTTGLITSSPYTVASTARRSSYSKFTPRASVRYEISPRTNVYFSYSQGFRGGEWNSSLPSDDPSLWVDAKQETINAFEAGLKSASGALRYEFSGFYYDYKNLQISSTAFVGGRTIVTLQNAPSAKIYGAEANADFDVSDSFKLRAGLTWLHARYGDGFVYIGTSVNPNVAGFNANSDPMKTFANITSVTQNLSGLPMARAPDLSGYLGFDYKVPVAGGGLLITANVKYSSRYVVTDPSVWGGETQASYNARKALNANALPDNTALLAGTSYVGRANQQRATQGDTASVNASITWTDPSEHFYARIWGTNLTDQTVRIHYRPSSSTYIPVGEPRSFGGTLGYKF